MSKSFNVSFEQSFKVTLTEEIITAIRKGLVMSVKLAEECPEAISSSQRAVLARVKEMLLLEDDEFLPLFLKTAFRQGVRDEFVEMLTKDKDLGCSKFAPAAVKITPRNVACVVPSQECACNFCRSF